MTMSRLMADGIERGNIKLRERERKEVAMIMEYLRANPRRTASEIRAEVSWHDSVLLPWMVHEGLIVKTKVGNVTFYEVVE